MKHSLPSPDPAPDGTPALRWKFLFSPFTLAMLILALALCAAGLSLTTWQFVDFLRTGNLASALEWAKFFLLYAVSIFIAVIVTAMLIRSEYVLTDQRLTLVFGLIRMRYGLDTIRSAHLFKGANKLALYFNDEKTRYTVIVISPKSYDDFVRAIILRNERIAFTFSTPEEEEEFKKKK